MSTLYSKMSASAQASSSFACAGKYFAALESIAW